VVEVVEVGLQLGCKLVEVERKWLKELVEVEGTG
jgi:hypothetical protein